MSTQWEIDIILNIWFTCIRLNFYYALFIPALPLKVKVGAKNVSYKIDISYDIEHTYQGVMQTKMEVGIQFWAPNLGLSPKSMKHKLWEENCFKEQNI